MEEIKISFDPNWKNIALAVSGGADSALLTYLLCSEVNRTQANLTIHIINNIRCWKDKPWQQTDIDKILNWFYKKFPNIEFKLHRNFVPPELEWGDKGRTIVDEYGKLVSGDTLELRAWAEYVCFHNKVEAYYNGVTRNPRSVDFQGMSTRDIEPNSSNSHLKYMIHMGVHVYHPFRFLEKSVLIKEYRKLEIVDLLEITRSCEGTFENLNYKNYSPGQYVPVCGECFWCKEREWAIEQSK